MSLLWASLLVIRSHLSTGVFKVHPDNTVRELSESVLAQHGWPELGGDFDLFGERLPELPTTPGVYAILINDGETLRYPLGRSAIVYLGCAFGAGGLGKRLRDHRRYAQQCREETARAIYYPRYEWVNAAGGICLFSEAPEGGMTAQGMETLLLNEFVSTHYTLPIANGQHGAKNRPRSDLLNDQAEDGTAVIPSPLAPDEVLGSGRRLPL